MPTKFIGSYLMSPLTILFFSLPPECFPLKMACLSLLEEWAEFFSLSSKKQFALSYKGNKFLYCPDVPTLPLILTISVLLLLK
ncbi:unnamed protein product [Meloidogyne enterolobii]|uniref:Uncharacterized protein n=1 Tax=Meloidogyne enterolobii TaxID=390850 RepID=A0ACB0YWR5_MELEN